MVERVFLFAQFRAAPRGGLKPPWLQSSSISYVLTVNLKCTSADSQWQRSQAEALSCPINPCTQPLLPRAAPHELRNVCASCKGSCLSRLIAQRSGQVDVIVDSQFVVACVLDAVRIHNRYSMAKVVSRAQQVLVDSRLELLSIVGVARTK